MVLVLVLVLMLVVVVVVVLIGTGVVTGVEEVVLSSSSSLEESKQPKMEGLNEAGSSLSESVSETASLLGFVDKASLLLTRCSICQHRDCTEKDSVTLKMLNLAALLSSKSVLDLKDVVLWQRSA